MPSFTKIQSGFMEAQGALPVSPGTAAAPGLKFSDHAGTGMFSPSTGAIGFSTSGHQQALTIDSSGNLIIGDANTNNANAIANDLVIGNTSSGKRSGITIVSNSGGDGNIFFSDGTGNDQLKGQIVYDQTANAMRFYTSNSQRLSIESSGKLEAYKGTSTTGKTSGSEALTVGNGAGSHRFAVYPDGTTVIGGTGDIGNYNILLQNDGQAVFKSNIQIADSIIHENDTNTKIRFPGNDTFSIETNGNERFSVSSTGKITQTNFNGIGLHMSGSGDPTIRVQDTDGTNQYGDFAHNGGDSYIVTRNNTSHGEFLVYSQNGTTTESRLKVDVSGRLLVGTTTSPSSGDGQYAKLSVSGYVGGTPGGASINIMRDEAATSMSSGDTVGTLQFTDINGLTFASIKAFSDGASGGVNGVPGALSFRTESAGSDSDPVERLRIASDGQIGMGKAGAVTPNGNSPLTIQESDSNSETICLRATNSGGNGSQPGIVMKTAAGGHIGGIYCDVNSDYMRLSTSGDDRVIITNTGNIGIGESNPTSSLVIKKSNNSGVGPELVLNNSSGSYGDEMSILFSSGGTPRSGLKGGITTDGQGSGWFSLSTRNPSGNYGERIRVNSSGNLIVDAGGDSQDIQIKSHSANSGHGQIYLRGNASNESSSIKLNHYGHADYVIAAGRSGNGLLSITSTDGGTDGIIVNNSGSVGIGTASPSERLHVHGNIKLSRSATYNNETTIFTSHVDAAHYGSLYHDTTLSTGGFYWRNNSAGTIKELWRIEPTAELRSSNISIDGQPWTHDTQGYAIFSSDNHANTFVGQNIRLGHSGNSGNHTLKIINQHSHVGGAGMYIGGNGNTNAINKLRFYVVTNPNQSAGSDVTSNYHWELRQGGQTGMYSYGKYLQTYTTVLNASMFRTVFSIPMTGSTAYEIRVNGTGNGVLHITCMASHWTSSYDLIRESYLSMDSYNNFSTHDQFNRSNATQGAWSFSRPASGQTGYQSHLVINKSAGNYGGGMTGVIIIESHRPMELVSVT